MAAEYHHHGPSVCDLKYHLIWVTKYRYAVLTGDVATRCRDLIREICQAHEVKIVRGAVSPDHLHLLVSAPPVLAPAKLVQYLKGKSSRRLQEEFPALRKRYWGSIYGRGATSVRRSARSMKRRSNATSKSESETTTGRGNSEWSVAGSGGSLQAALSRSWTFKSHRILPASAGSGLA